MRAKDFKLGTVFCYKGTDWLYVVVWMAEDRSAHVALQLCGRTPGHVSRIDGCAPYGRSVRWDEVEEVGV